MPVPETERSLILVKHSLPAVNPFVDAHQWTLSAEGQRRSERLAESLSQYHPSWIFGSPEPKAWETAHIVAQQLELPLESVEGLHEHLRRTTPYMERYRFEKAVRTFFEQPEQLVFGEETARQSLERFSAAVDYCLQLRPDETLVVVAHGTVISLYLHALCGMDAFGTWQRLGMPSYARLLLPSMRLDQLIPEIS